jgi:hypothetical protein
MNEIGQAINLLDGAQFAAGKNKIINGDFGINQRSFTSVTSTNFGFDRWTVNMSDGTVTYSAQTFTTGAAPVAGYEGKNFARVVTTGQTLSTARTNFNQNIEDVRTLAGQTATVSFWAKAATGTPKIAIELNQSFGTGGSPSSSVTTYAGQVTLSTSWARYSVTIAVPSISGKTIGTNPDSILQLNLFVSAGSNLNARTGSLGIQSNTFDLWGVQVEAANTASNFQTATGTLQGELAACQRYYIRYAGSATYSKYGIGYAYSTTAAVVQIPNPVTMRVVPTAIEYSTQAISVENFGSIAITALTINGQCQTQPITLTATVASGATQFRPYELSNNNSASGYVALSAEL